MKYEELDPREAQKIADGIMEILPYNINIMNRKGYIIASGDKARLNTLHTGAVMALNTSEAYIVYKDTNTERRGVNLPILYEGSNVGVIGISGDCDEVMPIAKIVVLTAQLMLENQRYRKLALLKEERKRDFLFEWASYDKDNYSATFIERGKAHKIDVTIPSVAVLLIKDKASHAPQSPEGYSALRSRIHLKHNEYIIREWLMDTLVVLEANSKLETRIAALLEDATGIKAAYVGALGVSLYQSIQTAQKVKQYASSLNRKECLLYYRDLSLDLMMLSTERTAEEERLCSLLKEADVSGELSETIYVYMNNTPNISEICQQLHIHRNTLNYRLHRIQEVTNKNPRTAKDLMVLYLSVLRNQMA